MPDPIDLNRDVIMRKHPKGFQVAMYKDDPGSYLSASGNPISTELAGEAGFETAGLARDKERRDRLESAHAAINAEYGEEENVEVAEAGGYKVFHETAGRFSIRDQDGSVMTEESLGRDQAIELMHALASKSDDDEGGEGDGAET